MKEAGNQMLNDALLKELVCPICGDYCTFPIFACTDGHIVCHDCVVDNTECGVCKQETPYTRNLFAEQIAGKVTAQCKQGCDERFPLAELKLHEPDCQPKINYDCYVMTLDGSARCEWAGHSKHALIKHVDERHSGSLAKQKYVMIVTKIDFDTTLFDVKLVSAHDEVFWAIFHYIPSKEALFPYVYFIGLPAHASRYSFLFSFHSKEMRRTITYESLCYCAENWCKVGELTVPFHRDLLNLLMTDGELRCEVRITDNSA